MSRRAAPSLECPLASLGRNTPSLDTNLYHHPLSSSPLDPQIYQMSRKSPILEITQNDRIIVSAATNLHHQIQQRASSIATSNRDNHHQNGKNNSNIYHLSQSSTSSVEQNVYGLRRDNKPPATHQMGALLSYHDRTNPKVYLLDDRLGGGGGADDQCSSTKGSQNDKYYMDDKLETFYNIDNSKLNHNTERYYLEDNLNMCHYQAIANENKFIQKSMVRRTSSPSETSESDRYLIEPMNHLKLSNNRMFEKSPFQATRYNANSPQCFINGLSRICRYSPTFDQGYHTLVSPSPTGQQTPGPWINNNNNNNKRNTNYRSGDTFDRLPDEIVLKIFNWLDNCELCKIARVCRRFETLIWKPILWKVIRLKNNMEGDKALKIIFKRLCRQKRNANCLGVEHILLSDGCKITDKGLDLVSRKCPELTHFQIQFSASVSNSSLNNVLTQCTNLQHLDITGCTQITHLDTHPSLDDQITNRRLLLQYLDLTDCTAVTDNGLKVIVKNCPQLVFVYLRRCIQITDIGLKHLPSFCVALRELSVSDCSNITDFGLYELAKLGATLRYLSVAKCDKISDAGLKVIARRCYKLRYLNARGCEAVSDDSITVLAKSCPRLRALDIGKCDVSDTGLRALAESCPNLKKLGLRNCDMITDIGVQCIAYYCRGLQQLNIQDCQITIEGYRAVKKYCKRCVIEHTNPGFC